MLFADEVLLQRFILEKTIQQLIQHQHVHHSVVTFSAKAALERVFDIFWKGKRRFLIRAVCVRDSFELKVSNYSMMLPATARMSHSQ